MVPCKRRRTQPLILSRPPLKTAPIFGNISGVMNFEQGERDESGHLTNMASKVNRDIHQMRSVHRQILTAAWSTQPTELPADECIEDIFAGGDGYGRALRNGRARKRSRRRRYSQSDEESEDDDEDEDRTPTPPASRKNSEYGLRSGHAAHSHHHGHRHHRHQSSKSSDRTIGRSRDDHGKNTSSSSDDRRDEDHDANRLTEADVREDMRTWHISPPP